MNVQFQLLRVRLDSQEMVSESWPYTQQHLTAVSEDYARSYSAQGWVACSPSCLIIALELYIVVIYSCLCVALYGAAPQSGFSSLHEAFVSLFALSTTVNNPDVWLPVYAHSRWNALVGIPPRLRLPSAVYKLPVLPRATKWPRQALICLHDAYVGCHPWVACRCSSRFL